MITPIMKQFKYLHYLLLIGLVLVGCAKEYSFENPKEKTIGNWEFKQETTEYAGTIDTAYLKDLGNEKQLVFSGKNMAGIERLHVNVYGTEIAVGTYLTDDAETSLEYSAGNKTIYKAGQLLPGFRLSITSIEGEIYTGTFQGTVADSTGKEVQLTEGKFKFRLSDNTAPESEGTLGVTAGICQPVTLNGNFLQGVEMDEENTVEVQINVTKAGAYEISTDKVNGVQFFAAGNVTTTGVHTISLIAEGTPEKAGNFKYTLRYGNSQCAFSVTYEEEFTGEDYYPLKTANTWSYEAGGRPLFVFTVDAERKAIGEQRYYQIAVVQNSNPIIIDTLLIRKEISTYYSFSTHLLKDNPQEAKFFEHIILKDNVPAGTSWESKIMEYKDGDAVKEVRAKYTILEKNVAATVGEYDFEDVIKVKEEITGLPGGPVENEKWYARNVGLIYSKILKGEQDATVFDYRIN